MAHVAGGRVRTVRAVRAVNCRHFSAPGGSGGIAGKSIAGVSRFYKKVDVQPIKLDGKSIYTVTLDDKAVKTPMRSPLHLSVPSMAYAIAHEWDAQRDKIKPALMPIMTLASTVIDLEKNTTRQEVIDEMIHYLHSDTLCYQVTADQSEKLAKQQQKKWDPIRKWFTEEFKSSGELDVSHGSIGKLNHDESLVDCMRKGLEQCDVFELVPLRAMTKECKSLITAWALFKRRVTPKEAMELSRVEEEFQINNWGLVEGGHDVDRVNCAVNLSSASFFVWLLHNHPTSMHQEDC